MTKEANDEARATAAVIAAAIERGRMPHLRGLRACRERAGLNQTQASFRVGVVHQTFCAWEAGKNWPTALHLARIASVLGCSIEELYLGPRQEGGAE